VEQHHQTKLTSRAVKTQHVTSLLRPSLMEHTGKIFLKEYYAD